MLDISAIRKRYFNIKIDNLNLEVEPPKIKALKKIYEVIKSNNEEAMDG
jgi:elongation factor P hydroxylase